MDMSVEQLVKMSEAWLPVVLEYSGKLTLALITLLIGWWLIGKLTRSIGRLLDMRQVDRALGSFIGSLVSIVLRVLLLISVASMIGVETTSFIAMIGAAGLAIGLALQGTLSHFAAGVMLVVFRPFKIGEVIDTAGVIGKVEKLDLFATTLVTGDNKTVTVPNGKIWGSTIQNLTDREYRRVEVGVGISYEADLDKAQETLVAAISKLEGVRSDPAPQAYLKELGASSVNFELRCFVAPGDYWAVREQMVRACKKALDQARIGIPYPQLDLHVNPGSFPVLSGKQQGAQKQPGIA